MSERLLGTMITYCYRGIDLDDELELAGKLGASVLEILPGWSSLPDPSALAVRVRDRGFRVHSAHGCWGGQTIRAQRVDLGSTDASTHQESIDDIMRCIDWLAIAGGTCLVVHPGGLSDETEQAQGARLWLACSNRWPAMPRLPASRFASKTCHRGCIPEAGCRTLRH